MQGVALIHLIGIGVSVILLYQSSLLIRNRKESVLELLTLITFGVTILVLSLGGQFTVQGLLHFISRILNWFGFQSGTPETLFLAIFICYLISIYSVINGMKNREESSKLNQEIALLRYEIEQVTEEEKESTDD